MQSIDEHLSAFHILADEGILLTFCIRTDDKRRLVATTQGDGDDAVLVRIDVEVGLDALSAVGSLCPDGAARSRVELQYLSLQQLSLRFVDVEPLLNALPAFVDEIVEVLIEQLDE